ncbi:MAG: Smr/MutS family protein [Pacificimonas sp.]|jgi:DNA-nicking Smr family endonuclease|nr:Smr/MutS family protein [Pacificimonas sp.]
MADKLPPKDAALWQRVAQTVRPLGTPKPAAGANPLPRVQLRPRAPDEPAASRSAPRSPLDGTLDGGWDRRLRKGRARADRTIDLHGDTQTVAHAKLVRGIQSAYDAGARIVLVIHGKPRGPDEAPRGILSQRFPIWCEGQGLRPYIAAIRPAHQTDGGAGASYVVLRRKR